MTELSLVTWARRKVEEKRQRELKADLDDMRQELMRLKAEHYDLMQAGLNGPATKRLPGLIEQLDQRIKRIEQQATVYLRSEHDGTDPAELARRLADELNRRR